MELQDTCLFWNVQENFILIHSNVYRKSSKALRQEAHGRVQWKEIALPELVNIYNYFFISSDTLTSFSVTELYKALKSSIKFLLFWKKTTSSPFPSKITSHIQTNLLG